MLHTNKCYCSTRALAQAVVFVSKFVANEQQSRKRTDQVTYRALGSTISSVNSSSYSSSKLTSSSDESSTDLSSSFSSSGDDLSDCDSHSSAEEEDGYFEIPVIVNIFRDNCHNFPAPVWYEPVQNQKKPRIPVRKTIRRDNRLAKSSELTLADAQGEQFCGRHAST